MKQGVLSIFCIVTLILVLLVPGVYANSGQIKLLAVKELPNGEYEGSPADMYLEIIPGKGRVFIEAVPLTKLDTQLTTRIAKSIACKYTERDCSGYDFIYTIKSNSGIIGGPSAGAATAMLTIATLEGAKLSQNISVTGTINSGKAVGYVGGLKAKIIGAKDNGITKIMIPYSSRYVTEGNTTIDLYDIGKEVGIEVLEVSTLEDVITGFTGRKTKDISGDILIDENYKGIMEKLSLELCERSNEIVGKIKSFEGINNNSMRSVLLVEEAAGNLSKKADESYVAGDYYSSASYCFGANVRYRYLLLKSMNMSDEEIEELSLRTLTAINESNKNLEQKEIKTITDLQTFMVVKERLLEAEERANFAINVDNTTNRDDIEYNLAYGMERLYSARSWSEFFDIGGEEFNLNKESLRQGCLLKINEATDSLQYIELYLPGLMTGTADGLFKAQEYLKSEDYELCLFKASKSKAESDVIVDSIGIPNDRVESVVSQKIKIAGQTVSLEIEKGRFPIVGYSYYEYANSLKGYDDYSALLYAEYALELSNLDLYLEENKQNFHFILDDRGLMIFIFGLGMGLLLANLAISPRRGEKKSKKKAPLWKKKLGQ